MSFKAIKVERNLTRTLLVTQRIEIENNNLPTNTTKGISGLTNTDNDKLAIGSRAICSEDWSRWILTPDNKWVETTGGSGGVGGLDIITDEEVNDIINSLF